MKAYTIARLDEIDALPAGATAIDQCGTTSASRASA
jgi:hypothetical protein